MNNVTIDSVLIQWLGHASFLLEGDGKKVYIDPFEIGEEPDFDNKADILKSLRLLCTARIRILM